MIRFGIRVYHVSPIDYERLTLALFGKAVSLDYQDGNVLVFGRAMFWQFSLILSHCVCFGDVECGIAREETE